MDELVEIKKTEEAELGRIELARKDAEAEVAEALANRDLEIEKRVTEALAEADSRIESAAKRAQAEASAIAGETESELKNLESVARKNSTKATKLILSKLGV